MLFQEIIAVYSENHTEPVNIKCKNDLMLLWLVHIATMGFKVLKLNMFLVSPSSSWSSHIPPPSRLALESRLR
jgi:hypothetical protein